MKKNYFDRIPVRIDKSGRTDGVCYIIHENTGFFNFAAQRLFKRPRQSFIRLDEYGEFIWNTIDGIRSVYDIALMFSKRFDKGNIELTAKFISDLERNGFIGYIGMPI